MNVTQSCNDSRVRQAHSDGHFRNVRSCLAIALIAVTACAARKETSKVSMTELTVEPKTSSLGGMSVSASLNRGESHAGWDVTIVFARAPNLPPLQGEEVSVQLLDSQGKSMSILERPSKVLPEFGGSLGNSANAHFHFESSGVTPAELVVTYRGEVTRFRIVASGQ
jgi:hypothetical protein